MELEEIVRPAVEARGLELVEVAFHRQDGRRTLRVTVDREGGIDLESIAQLSESISRLLDERHEVRGPFTLEVSSPGVERPLREPRDFARRVGERVKVKLARPVEGSRTVHGTIVFAGPGDVQISTEQGPRSVAYEEISSARTIFEWGDDK